MNRRNWALAGLGIALILAGGWAVLRKPSRKNGKAASHFVAAELGSIEDTIEATGSVAPLNRVEIKPPIAGRVEQLLVDEGDTVKAGQIIAWMSSSDRAAILDAARAKGMKEFKHWEDAYKPTPIVAPLSGVVILRAVVVGQTVDPGVVLFAMSDSLIVLAQVDESDIGRVKLDMPARVTLDSYPDRSVEGKVFDILYEGKNVSNVIQYGVKVRPTEVPPYFRSQMTANISFVVGRQEKTILIPAIAVKELGGGVKQVMVTGADGQPEAREIKTGIESGEKVEVLSGLQAGEEVLVAQGRYVPQQGPQTSPLTFGGRPSGPTGQAPKPKKGG